MQDKIGQIKTSKTKNKKILLIAVFTAIALFIVASVSVTYAYLTSSIKKSAGIEFGNLAVAIDYTDNTKQHSTFALSGVENVTPGMDIPLIASITSSRKNVNNINGSATASSYLRFRVAIDGFENETLTTPVDAASQQALDYVAQNIRVKDSVTTWTKGADGYIYFTGNTTASRKLEWAAGRTESLAGNILLNFPETDFAYGWSSRFVRLTLEVQTYQYEYLNLNYSSCADTFDMVNCASSLLDDYNFNTGLGTNVCAVRTAFCSTSTTTFTRNAQATLTNFAGNTSTLRIYSAGKRLAINTNYTISGTTITVENNATANSLFLVCSQSAINLVDSADTSNVYQTIYGKQDGTLPLKVNVPSKENVSFIGYYTATNGGGTKIYDESGARVVASTSATTLYANFISADATLAYRGTIKAYQGDTAFTQAFTEAQTLDALSAEITIFRDFTLSQSYTVTTQNMELTIKSIKKQNNEYCTLSFTGSGYNCFALTSTNQGNTICFEHINLVAPSGVENMRAVMADYNNVAIRGYVTFTNFNVNSSGEGAAIRCHLTSSLDVHGENTATPDVVFTNCSSAGAGGAIKTDTVEEINVVNAKFDTCSAGVGGSNAGGAIACWRSTITLENSTFVSNNATTYGGAIFLTTTTATINSGTFDSNTSTYDGGVICVNNDSVIYVKGGTYTRNSAGANAGGVLGTTNNNQVYISGGVFGDSSKTACATSSACSNKAGNGGGAISINKSSVCEIFSTKTTCPLIAYNYGGANTDRSGGAIRVLENASLKIYKGEGASQSPEIRYNYAVRGGAIYCHNTITTGTSSAPTLATVTLEGCYIHHNESVYGGAYYCRSANGNNLSVLEIKDGALIDSNKATTGYAGIGGALGSIIMSGGKVSNNVAANGTGGGIVLDVSGSSINISGGEISGNSSSGGGGVVIGNGVTANITGGKIINNRANSWGAGINFSSGSRGSMSNVEISGNTSSSTGGGVGVNSTITISNCTISNNTATSHGGGVFCDTGANLTMSGCTIGGNTAGNQGGGIYCNAGTQTFSDITVSNNTSTGNGGGIYLNNGTFTFNDSITILNNTSGNRCGGIYFYSERSTDYTLDCNLLVKGNSCASQGGGLRFQFPNCNVYLKRGVICDNRANSGSGGAITNAWNAGTLILDGENIRIYNNYASDAGGAIHLEAWNSGNNDSYTDDYGSNLTINAGYIYGNVAGRNGGAIIASCGNNSPNSYAPAQSIVTINGGEIYGNSCAGSAITTSSPYNRGGGGAICAVYWAQVTINGGKIYGNSTTATGTNTTDYAGGGAIILGNSANLTINGGQIGGDTFSNANSAPNGFGGAIMLGNTSTCLITGGIIGSNRATEYANSTACANYAKTGGAIWVGPQATLTIEADANKNPILAWNYSSVGEIAFDGGCIKSHGAMTNINANKTAFDATTAVYFKYNNSGGGRGSAFYGGNATIKNCVFEKNYGGVVRCTLTMDYCRFVDNCGACIQSCNANSVVRNTIMSGTTRRSSGYLGHAVNNGAITLENCEIYNNVYGVQLENTSIVTNCNIHDNINNGLIAAANSNVTVTGCTIASNQNNTLAGTGVYVNYGATAKIVNCIISDNEGTFGSAVYNEGGYVEIQGCNINNNRQTRSGAVTALPTTVSNVTYAPQTYITGIRGTEVLNTSDLSGWTNSHSDRFTSSYDSTNKVTTISCAGSGGWEEYYKTINLTAGKTYLISVDYENVTANATDSFDRAYEHTKYGLKMQLLNAQPANDSVSKEVGGGGPLSTFANTGEAINTKSRMFIEWTCTSTATYYINFNFGTLRDGVTHTLKFKNLVVSEYQKGSATIIDNNQRIYASTVGGYGGAGVTNGANSPMGLHNVTISNNTNRMSNSAAGIISDFGIQISACNIFGNSSNQNAGGLKFGAGNTDTIICAGTNIYNNITTSGAGGGILTDSSSPMAIIGANIYGNSCTSYGGGISSATTLHLVAANIYGNTATGNGGGINATGVLTIHAGTIIGGTSASSANVSSDYGGGISANNTITMYGGCIGNPNATEHATQTAYANKAKCGGGLNHEGTFVLNGGSISYNWATQDCGGLRSSKTNTLSAGEICYNGSVNGGGAVVFNTTATITINGTKIHHNYATNGGGGFVVWNTINSAATLQSGEIYSNEASVCGGIWLKASGAQMTMSGGSVYNNTAINNCGGLGINSGATFTMSDGIFRDNYAGTVGGAVANYGTFIMSNGTITNNTAGQNGGGVWKTGSATNSITGGTITGNLPQDTYNA